MSRRVVELVVSVTKKVWMLRKIGIIGHPVATSSAGVHCYHLLAVFFHQVTISVPEEAVPREAQQLKKNVRCGVLSE